MAYPPARSVNDELRQGALDGRYRTGSSDRGGDTGFTRPPQAAYDNTPDADEIRDR